MSFFPDEQSKFQYPSSPFTPLKEDWDDIDSCDINGEEFSLSTTFPEKDFCAIYGEEFSLSAPFPEQNFNSEKPKEETQPRSFNIPPFNQFVHPIKAISPNAGIRQNKINELDERIKKIKINTEQAENFEQAAVKLINLSSRCYDIASQFRNMTEELKNEIDLEQNASGMDVL